MFFDDNAIKVFLKTNLQFNWGNRIEDLMGKQGSYIQDIESKNQGFTNLHRPLEYKKMQTMAKEINSNFKYLIVVGIGGSILGPQTIFTALKSKCNHNFKKVLFVDNIDSELISSVTEQIELDKSLFLIQTKSGNTPETIASFFYFKSLLEKENLELKRHFVFITDPKSGYLRSLESKTDYQYLSIPENVGGRFSVLSNIGLFISAILGLNTDKMLEASEICCQENYWNKNSMALKLAIYQFLFLESGINQTVIMPYGSNLRNFGFWYSQLLAESTGKTNKQGKATGITPISSIGVTDQHSLLQLFSDGSTDKMFLMLKGKSQNGPVIETNEPEWSYLNGHKFDDLLNAEYMATKSSLIEKNKPVISLEIETVDEYELSYMFQFMQISTAFLGELLKVNTFDQPGVERSKILTKKFLTNTI